MPPMLTCRRCVLQAFTESKNKMTHFDFSGLSLSFEAMHFLGWLVWSMILLGFLPSKACQSGFKQKLYMITFRTTFSPGHFCLSSPGNRSHPTSRRQVLQSSKHCSWQAAYAGDQGDVQAPFPNLRTCLPPPLQGGWGCNRRSSFLRRKLEDPGVG